MSLVDLGKRLLEAAKLGMTDEVRTLMSNGAPFTTDWLGNSPLHFAAQSGHIATGEVLLRAGISRDARTKVDRTPLHVSSQFGHADLVELLLRNGADIEAKDMLRMTPLHWAVEKTHVHIIQLLLAHGADINCQNKFDKTPVDIAVFNGRSDVADLLQMSRVNPVVIQSDATIVEEVTTSETLIEPEVSSPIVTATPVRLLSQNSGVKIGTVIPKVEGVSRNTDASDGSTEQSSTAVLATLAALAEATAPINAASAPPNTTASEALNWLEMHGITMISGGDNSTIVSSSMESGQTLTLTEAGKLALNQMVKQQTGNVQEEVEENEETFEPTTATVVEEDGTQRVITIVGSEEVQAEPNSVGPIVVAVRSTEDSGNDETVVKKLKLCDQIVIKTEKLDQTELQRQLQVAQKRAEGYKLQLQQKEQEAENYKKQLTEINAKTVTTESEQLSS